MLVVITTFCGYIEKERERERTNFRNFVLVMFISCMNMEILEWLESITCRTSILKVEDKDSHKS